MLLQFEPITSTIDPSFLFELARFKLEVQKLDSSRIDITGLLESSTVLKVGENDQALPSRLSVSRESFNTTLNQDNGTIKGWLQNYNSFTEFKNADKQHLLQCFGDEIMARIAADSEFQDLNYLVSFGVICFADLKKYQYYHWFMFPAISPSVPYDLESIAVAKDCADFELDVLGSAYQEFAVSNPSSKLFFIIQSSKIYSVGEYAKLTKSSPDSIVFGFLDPSASSEHPGWPLRNYLYLIFTKFNLQTVRVLCYRPARKQSDSNRSLLLTISGNVQGPTSCVGWERNGSKLVPKKTDLRPMMDPLQLANTAVDLNLKLMKWRLAPDLDLGKIAQTKCLLLGAGTLGCYVARSLMAWGVRQISFVDNGNVSFSNPVRQPLFNFKDCLEGGSPKAAKAAEALQNIFPGVVRLVNFRML